MRSVNKGETKAFTFTSLANLERDKAEHIGLGLDWIASDWILQSFCHHYPIITVILIIIIIVILSDIGRGELLRFFFFLCVHFPE